MRDRWKFALSGAAAGAANGLFGAGGGMVLVPLLTKWAKVDDREAFATSISIVLPLCLISILVYTAKGSIDIMAALPYLMGGIIGGFVGGKVFKKVPTAVLHKALGIIILYGGIRQFL